MHDQRRNAADAPGAVEDKEPHGRAERGRQELVLEAGEMRVEPGALRAA